MLPDPYSRRVISLTSPRYRRAGPRRARVRCRAPMPRGPGWARAGGPDAASVSACRWPGPRRRARARRRARGGGRRRGGYSRDLVAELEEPAARIFRLGVVLLVRLLR